MHTTSGDGDHATIGRKGDAVADVADLDGDPSMIGLLKGILLELKLIRSALTDDDLATST